MNKTNNFYKKNFFNIIFYIIMFIYNKLNFFIFEKKILFNKLHFYSYLALSFF